MRCWLSMTVLIFLFAGQVAPIALLPGALHTLAVVLPYRYALSFPVEVLVGNLSRGEVWTGLAIQLAWLAIIGVLYRFVWNKGLKHYVAVGG
ncbi:MAG: hypothetical protein KatS3mg057_1025 [Herpetosiphonaceae bacterium]|nr:MAG: hypothetical protein KatS3mg057_1025 [Herpetosiphonaceae bacterium]